MRDWILLLAPVVAITYFVAYPQQFGELLNWARNFVYY